MGFEILMGGVGDAFSVDHWHTHFAVRKDDFVLAIDCPDSYAKILKMHAFSHRGETLAIEHLDAMWVTHLHGDHVNGLEMTLAYRHFVRGGMLKVYTSEDVANSIWESRLEVALGTLWDGESHQTVRERDYMEVHPVRWGQKQQIGPFTIETRRTVHHLPTTALKISDGEATLGYSCDTAFDPELVEWLASADQILHETGMGVAHTPLFKLMDLSAELKARMILVHYPDDLARLAAKQDIGLQVAQQGAIYAVEPH